jgi:formylglycine-generating enzyme required for sulfatase activity
MLRALVGGFGLGLASVLAAHVPPAGSRAIAVRPNAVLEQRVALVIGNAAYRELPLRNPVNDARAISAKLTQLGFQVVLRENLTQKQIGPTLREFRSRLTPGAVALFFYAGHGLQVEGTNYLPAVDADIATEEDVPTQSIDVNKVLEVMEIQRTRLNLVFLDACRNNPFTRSFRSAGGGLARITPPSGTILSFATRPGSVAADGAGVHGLYTEYLLRAMDEPDLVIELALKKVLTGVKLASKGKQEPWIEGGIEGDFYFRPVGAYASGPAPSNAPPAAEPTEQETWASIEGSRDPRDFNAYLTQYPTGQFALQARNRLKGLIPPPVPSSAAAPVPFKPGETWKAAGTGLEFVCIPPGSFQMGSRDQTSESSERPIHQVTISHTFLMQKTNVTVGQFRAFVQATGYKTEAERRGGAQVWVRDQGRYRMDPNAIWRNPDLAAKDSFPVVCVSWNDAQAFCSWASKVEGVELRLPTEAEWEYACRAGTTGERYADLDAIAWYFHNTGHGKGGYTGYGKDGCQPVGQKQPNAFGLFDMIGNAMAWCQDWFGSYPAEPQTEPMGPSSGSERVVRGSSWVTSMVNCRAAIRRCIPPSDARFDLGFRLVRTIP